ncbi:hypothetical protein MMC17_009452 [Xylographa soralifera]|nr:hypothetical protein [Xylographa soralifera]
MSSVHDGVYGIIQYGSPDNSVSAQERALYTLPSSKSITDINQRLYDMRTSNDIVKGPEGLDVQGFTYIEHKSALSGEDWFVGNNVIDIYMPEVIDLICKATGAKRAVVDSIAFRRRVASEEEERNVPHRRGDKHDQAMSKLTRDTVRVPGRDVKDSVPPNRMVHVDYSLKGLRAMVRLGRKDILDAANPVIDAEDRGENPRYACYSVWRPLKTIERDPLVVLDWRATNNSELVPYVGRVLSGITPNGEYIRESFTHDPPKMPQNHRWYWMPYQQPNEVLILKFADTAAGELGEKNAHIAACCAHAAARIAGSEGLPPRESIECRIIAFWE